MVNVPRTRIRTPSRSAPRPRAGLLLPSPLIPALLLSSLLLSGCAPPGGAPSDLSGRNLVESVSFADWVLDDASGVYSVFQDESGTYAPPAAHPGAEVYRLENPNLLPGGDFEALAPPAAPPGWTVVNGGGGADTLETVSGAHPRSITGVTVHFLTDHAADRIGFEVTSGATGAVDGYLQDASYILRYNYRTQPSFFYEYNDGAASISLWNVFSGPDGDTMGTSWANVNDFPPAELVGDFPEKTVGADPAYYYTYGTLTAGGKNQEGYIDNFRLIRTDIPLKLRLTLDQTQDFSDQLVSGTYRFSLYVKQDPAAGTANRFASTAVTLGVGVDGLGGGRVTRYQASSDPAGWPAWTRISVEVYASLPDPPDAGDQIVLSVCPSDDTQGALSSDVGSVLIAAPSLEILTE